jgi:GGDEF domain-containing protein
MNGSTVAVAETMSVNELVVWSGMAGAILMLVLVAAADLVVQRSLAAARGLAFIVMMGGASVWASGLLQTLMPGLDATTNLVLQASFGPLAGALALNYLGVWLGEGRDESMTRWVLLVCTLVGVTVALTLAYLTVFSALLTPNQTLVISSTSYVGSVIVALLISLRGANLGDRLARWMAVACCWLIVMVTGLSAKMLAVPGLGLKTWALTALATVLYFLIVIALTILRTREVRRLRLLAKGLEQPDVNIQMPQGAHLIPKVADAIWRSDRLERDCVVAAVVVRNLYETGEKLGHGVESQILAVLAARIRRQVGFRNVVGLYHPRCFVMAVSSGQDPRRGVLVVDVLLKSVKDPIRVGPPERRFDFWPDVGVGVVDLRKTHLEPLAAINRAEQLALEDLDMGDLLSRPLALDSLPMAH